jgi:hypothetical protein
MPDVSDALLAALADAPPGARILQATFVSATSTGCLVDISGNRVPATMGTAWLPEVNEVVWLWVIGDRFFIMGPASIKPDQGVVDSVAGGLVTLTSSLGTTVVAPYTGSTPSAGQSMKLLWHGGPFAMLMSTSPAGGTAPPPPTTGATSHADEFPAIDAGSYGSGRWWTSQVYASDSNLGAWFYGSKISDTIPSGATIQKVEIYVSPQQISGSAPNFATHGYQTKPGGAPSLSTVGAVGIGPGWVDLGSVGVSIGNALKAGGGSSGVGVNHGGYNIFHSLAQDGYSGRLRITSTY